MRFCSSFGRSENFAGSWSLLTHLRCCSGNPKSGPRDLLLLRKIFFGFLHERLDLLLDELFRELDVFLVELVVQQSVPRGRAAFVDGLLELPLLNAFWSQVSLLGGAAALEVLV